MIMLARYRMPPVISLLPGVTYNYIGPLPGAIYYLGCYQVRRIISLLPGATYYYVTLLPDASSY